jgi:hypothetical protein
MASWTVGMIFFRSWRYTGDRFFVLFAWAFWILALQWTLLAAAGAADETRHYLYVVRLLAFILVLGAIAEKNRKLPDIRHHVNSKNSTMPGTITHHGRT